jgi:hypothetical protein
VTSERVEVLREFGWEAAQSWFEEDRAAKAMADEIATLREQLAAERHRAERMAAVVEAARAWDAVCDTDAAQQAADEWDAVAETVPGYAAACEALSAAVRALDAGDAP